MINFLGSILDFISTNRLLILSVEYSIVLFFFRNWIPAKLHVKSKNSVVFLVLFYVLIGLFTCFNIYALLLTLPLVLVVLLPDLKGRLFLVLMGYLSVSFVLSSTSIGRDYAGEILEDYWQLPQPTIEDTIRVISRDVEKYLQPDKESFQKFFRSTPNEYLPLLARKEDFRFKRTVDYLLLMNEDSDSLEFANDFARFFSYWKWLFQSDSSVSVHKYFRGLMADYERLYGYHMQSYEIEMLMNSLRGNPHLKISEILEFKKAFITYLLNKSDLEAEDLVDFTPVDRRIYLSALDSLKKPFTAERFLSIMIHSKAIYYYYDDFLAQAERFGVQDSLLRVCIARGYLTKKMYLDYEKSKKGSMSSSVDEMFLILENIRSCELSELIFSRLLYKKSLFKRALKVSSDHAILCLAKRSSSIIKSKDYLDCLLQELFDRFMEEKISLTLASTHGIVRN